MRWDEKRKYKRAYFRLDVEVRSQSCWQFVHALDVSAGGMFVVTEMAEPKGTIVEALFDFGNERFIFAQGTVAWVRPVPEADKDGKILPVGMGVEFTKFIPLTAKEFIERMASNI